MFIGLNNWFVHAELYLKHKFYKNQVQKFFVSQVFSIHHPLILTSQKDNLRIILYCNSNLSFMKVEQENNLL